MIPLLRWHLRRCCLAKGVFALYGSAWSLVPFLVVIPLALWTRQVLPGLAVGLLVGAWLLHPGPLSSVSAAVQYVLKETAQADNLRLILFLYGFGAFVGLVRVTGGVAGFAQWMTERVRSQRAALWVTWASSLFTFMAPDFRIVTMGPVMKQVFDRLRAKRQTVALIIDITSTPLIALIPTGTVFVGYMVGLLGGVGRHQAQPAYAYHLLLRSLPLNFFSLAMLGFGLWITWRHRAEPEPELPAEGAAGEAGERLSRRQRLHMAAQLAQWETARELVPALAREHRRSVASPDAGSRMTSDAASDGQSKPNSDADFPDPLDLVAEGVRPRLRHLVFPLVLLLALTLFLTWWDGRGPAVSVWQAFVRADAARAMLNAVWITIGLSFIWYALHRQPLARTLYGFMAGGNEMMSVIVLLILVWAVSAVSADLGFVPFTQRVLGHLIPPSLLAPALFLFGCLISYVIGSSFGTWGMLMPLGFSLAASTGASLALIAGAVFASGTFGGFASPLSDNTVAMATVMRLPVMAYARAKLVPALAVAAVCIVAYAVVGGVRLP